MPEYEVRMGHRVRVRAPAETTMQVAREMDIERSTVVRAIFKGRELILRARPEEVSRPRALVAFMESLGWRVPAEDPGGRSSAAPRCGLGRLTSSSVDWLQTSSRRSGSPASRRSPGCCVPTSSARGVRVVDLDARGDDRPEVAGEVSPLLGADVPGHAVDPNCCAPQALDAIS